MTSVFIQSYLIPCNCLFCNCLFYFIIIRQLLPCCSHNPSPYANLRFIAQFQKLLQWMTESVHVINCWRVMSCNDMTAIGCQILYIINKMSYVWLSNFMQEMKQFTIYGNKTVYLWHGIQYKIKISTCNLFGSHELCFFHVSKYIQDGKYLINMTNAQFEINRLCSRRIESGSWLVSVAMVQLAA